jgi:hypothetical protein
MGAEVLTDLLDVDTVVIGGPLWDRMSAHSSTALERRLHAHPVPGAVHELTALSSPFGSQVSAVGAGCLLLSRAFTPRPSDLLLVN